LIFTPTQIKQLEQLIDTYFTSFAVQQVSHKYLTTSEKAVLRQYGISTTNITPTVSNAFKFGMLSEILGSKAKGMSFSEASRIIRSKSFLPLDIRERAVLESLDHQAYNEIRGLGNRVKKDMMTVVIEQSKKTRTEYEAVIRDAAKRAVLNRSSLTEMARDIGKKTQDWARDLDRVSDYILHDAHDHGRVYQMKKSKQVKKVYKHVFNQACENCIRIYLTNGVGSKPREFTIDELLSNGSNIGRKAKDWLSIVGCTHPYCFLNPRVKIYTTNGWVNIGDMKVGDEVLTHMGRFRKVTELVRHKYKPKENAIFNLLVRYDGKEIELNGITENHPVLTQNGWKIVSELRKSDKIKILQSICANCDNPVILYRYAYKKSNIYCSKKCQISARNKMMWKNDGYRKKMLANLTLAQATSKLPQSKKKQADSLRRYFMDNIGRGKAVTKNANNAVRKLIKEGKYKLTILENGRKSQKNKNTYIERKMSWLLREMGISIINDYVIKRESIYKNGRKKEYRADIFLPEHNVIIECDGEMWHDAAKDKKRDIEVKRLIGADTFRFKGNDIRNDLRGCKQRIGRSINNHSGKYGVVNAEILNVKKKTGAELNTYFRHNKDRILYNFSVEEDESYIANGLVVHNCRCETESIPQGAKWDDDKQSFIVGRTKEGERVRGTIKYTITQS